MGILSAIGSFISNFFIAIFLFILLVVVAIFVTRNYVKADPDEALIITGKGSKPKVVIGRAFVRIPVVHSKPAKLTLKPIRVDLTTDDWVPTSDFIGAKVTATVNVKVDTSDDDTVRLAAQHWSNMKASDIANEIRGTLEGSIKEIIGKMELKDAARDRKKFGEEVLQSAQPDMKKLGLQVLTFNMKSLNDNQGVLAALGTENESQIKKTAAIAAANAKKEVREQKAKAAQEANEAENASLMAIAERENELRKKKAELKQESDVKQAEADVAYQLQQEQQRQELERRTVEADIVRQEKEVELEEKRVAIQERRLEAEKVKTADAELYERQRKAEAELFERTKKAEAEKVETEQQAAAKKIAAEAELFEEEKRARGIAAVGEAEAEKIKAIGLAEAEKERAIGLAKAEALRAEMEAMQEISGPMLGKLLIEKSPELASSFAGAIGNIDSVKIIGGSGEAGAGIGSYMDAMPLATSKFFDTMSEIAGVDMHDLIAANGFRAKTEKNINFTSDSKKMQEKLVAAGGRMLDEINNDVDIVDFDPNECSDDDYLGDHVNDR